MSLVKSYNRNKIGKIVLLLTLVVSAISQLVAQNGPHHSDDIQKQQTSKDDPENFPQLLNTNISGAPKLGKPQLIMCGSIPVKGEGMGWAAPAVFDYNKDGKKDLLIGEFGSGLEYKGITVGNFVRIYENEGTPNNPKFSDIYSYIRGVADTKDALGTPLSIYTWCCIGFTPRIIDLNNDGFDDILTGQYNPGYISWFRGSEKGFLPALKLEEDGDPMVGHRQRNYSLPITDSTSSSYWSYSSAAFGDFDKDGDFDMIVGGAALRICENIGTKTEPRFGKRSPLTDVNGKPLASGLSTVPYVVDWDGDGILDILMTDSYTQEGSNAVTFYRGLKSKIGAQFEPGIPLFYTKDGTKEFPGSWLNICVTDWNNDGINDLLIGTSVATLNGAFSHELSWQWENKTDIIKKNPAYYSANMKSIIGKQMQSAEKYKKERGMSDDELGKMNYSTTRSLFKHYFGKEEYKQLAHQGYVYVLLGEK